VEKKESEGGAAYDQGMGGGEYAEDLSALNEKEPLTKVEHEEPLPSKRRRRAGVLFLSIGSFLSP